MTLWLNFLATNMKAEAMFWLCQRGHWMKWTEIPGRAAAPASWAPSFAPTSNGSSSEAEGFSFDNFDIAKFPETGDLYP